MYYNKLSNFNNKAKFNLDWKGINGKENKRIYKSINILNVMAEKSLITVYTIKV
jgi:hypothetical protein